MNSAAYDKLILYSQLFPSGTSYEDILKEYHASAPLWNHRYKPPPHRNEKLRHGKREMIKDLKNGFRKRGVKPVFGCGLTRLEYVFLLENDYQSDVAAGIRRRMDELGIYDLETMWKNRKSDVISIIKQAAEGAYVYEGTLLYGKDVEAAAERLGFGEDLESFFAAFSFGRSEGLVVVNRGNEKTAIHEYVHLRDCSPRPLDALYSYPPVKFVYEFLTEVRTGFIAPGFPGIGERQHMVNAELLDSNHRSDPGPDSLESAMRYIKENKIEDLVHIAIEGCKYFGHDISIVQAKRAASFVAEYVVDCESANPVIAKEIRPEVLAIWK